MNLILPSESMVFELIFTLSLPPILMNLLNPRSWGCFIIYLCLLALAWWRGLFIMDCSLQDLWKKNKLNLACELGYVPRMWFFFAPWQDKRLNITAGVCKDLGLKTNLSCLNAFEGRERHFPLGEDQLLPRAL